MARNQKDSEWGGFRQARACHWPGKGGRLALYDCDMGAPEPRGPNGERWLIVWDPGGRKKGRSVHIANLRTAKLALMKLSEGQYDDWGLFEERPKAQEEKGGADNVVVVDATKVRRGDISLTDVLNERFPPEVIADKLEQLMNTQVPVYGMVEGKRAVVDWAPDPMAQLKAVQIILGYQLGTPVKRTEEVRTKRTTSEEFLQNLRTKRGYRQSVLQYIRACDEEEAKSLQEIAQRYGERSDTEGAGEGG